MGWGEPHARGCGTTGETEIAHQALDAISIPNGVLAERVLVLVARHDVLSQRIVTVDLDGRTIRYDKVAEAEAALDAVEQDNERLRTVATEMTALAKRLVRAAAQHVIDPMASLDVDAVKKAEAVLHGR